MRSAIPRLTICLLLLFAMQSTSLAGHIYSTVQGANVIRRSTLEGCEIVDLVQIAAESFPGGIALDLDQGKMYWANFRAFDPGLIQRADLDGSNVEVLIDGLRDPFGIALDLNNGKIYWADYDLPGDDGEILRADLDGSGIELLVTGVPSPLRIALDIDGGKMYWTDARVTAGDTSRIQRSNLDGSNIEDLLVGDAHRAFGGLALDLQHDKLYWTERLSGTSKVRMGNLDGSGAVDLVEEQGFFGDLALDLDHGEMRWTGTTPSGMFGANLDGSNVRILGAGSSGAAGIALDTRGAPDTPCPPEVPATSGVGLIVLVLGLLGLATTTLVHRRRRHRP